MNPPVLATDSGVRMRSRDTADITQDRLSEGGTTHTAPALPTAADMWVSNTCIGTRSPWEMPGTWSCASHSIAFRVWSPSMVWGNRMTHPCRFTIGTICFEPVCIVTFWSSHPEDVW
jgi:hypothetical protein